MILVHRSDQRGHVDHGWLLARHSFSFGEFHDPERMGFRALRVINEDVVQPGQGFGKHPHRDMEILTYVISGALAHGDSMENAATIRPGQVQYMCAGTGVFHSEFNASPTEPVHLLQIWLLPDRAGHEPGYEEMDLGTDGARDRMRLVASPDGDSGSVTWHQDARLYASKPSAGVHLEHDIAPGRHAWLQVVAGALEVNGTPLGPGDGLQVSDEARLVIAADKDSEFLLFDLA